MRSKVEIESLADDFSCWQRFGHDIETKSSPAEEPEAKSVGWGGTVDPSGMVSSHGNTCGWQWNKDPRLECLGLRGVFASDTTRKSFYPPSSVFYQSLSAYSPSPFTECNAPLHYNNEAW